MIEFLYTNLKLLLLIGTIILVFLICIATMHSGTGDKNKILKIIESELDEMPVKRNGSPINSIKLSGSGLFAKGAQVFVLKRMVVVFPFSKFLGLVTKHQPCIMFDSVFLRDKFFKTVEFNTIFRLMHWESTKTITFWYLVRTIKTENTEDYHRIKLQGEREVAFMKMLAEHAKNWNSKGNWKGNWDDDSKEETLSYPWTRISRF